MFYLWLNMQIDVAIQLDGSNGRLNEQTFHIRNVVKSRYIEKYDRYNNKITSILNSNPFIKVVYKMHILPHLYKKRARLEHFAKLLQDCA